MSAEQVDSQPTDNITELHTLTMSLLTQMEQLIGTGLIMCPKLEPSDPVKSKPDYTNVDERMNNLVKDVRRFEDIVNSTEEFHKTEEFLPYFTFLQYRQQKEEIKLLSDKNRELTSQLTSSIKEYNALKHEVTLTVDNALNSLL